MKKEIRLSKTAIDEALYQIHDYLATKYGYRQADYDMQALKWYINTGRANCEFLKALINSKYFMVARIIHITGVGVYDNNIMAVKRYLKISELNTTNINLLNVPQPKL